MARPRTATKILELRGAFDKNPQRKRDEEPEVKYPLGQPPAHLPVESIPVWHELTAMFPQQVATTADALAMEVLCSLVVEYRGGPFKFPAAKLIRMERIWGMFGGDPSSRARLSVPKAKKKNEFEDF